jgi:hypothetical protein
MKITTNYLHKAILFGLCFTPIILGGCDSARVKQNNETKISDKKVCVSVFGGTYGKSGIRARQFVGKGPKMRLVQWKTPDFQDDLQAVGQEKNTTGPANIAVQISWRVNVTKMAVESSFESLEAYSINLKPEDAARAAFWRFRIFDGDENVISASKPIDNKLRDVFSTESRGIIIPGNFGEAFGGVNGSRFDIAILDSNKNEIVTRNVYAAKGYEFKNSAKGAIEGLENMLLNLENCQIPATQLRVD